MIVIAAQLWLPGAQDWELYVPSADDRRRILRVLLTIGTAIQVGKGQRGLEVWPQLDGCARRGITR